MGKHHQGFSKLRCSTISSRENVKFILYKGSSMSSTLQDMDVLYYMPNKRIRTGDVVVIKKSEYKNKIIHRVISVNKQGIRTMGDCNPCPDSWLLKQNEIIGSVVYGYRGEKRFRVFGGLVGIALMLQVRLRHRILKVIYPILSMIVYYFPVNRVIIHFIQLKVIIFKRPNGTETHILFWGKVIGRKSPGQKWKIKSPFRFFLEESSLKD